MNVFRSFFAKEALREAKPPAFRLDGHDPQAQFAMKLMLALSKRTENTVISPSCLYMTLAMIACTTEGDTRRQIVEALSYVPEQEIPVAISSLASIEAPRYDCGNFHYSTAAALWLDVHVHKRLEFEQNAEFAIPINVEIIEMGSKRASIAMGEWLKVNTGGMYGNAPKTRAGDALVAMGTMHLRDAWCRKFVSGGEGIFTEDDGHQSKTNFMLSRGELDIMEWGNGALSLAYWLSSDCRMIISLPPKGTPLKSHLMSNSAWCQIESFAHGHQIGKSCDCNLYLPKFAISSDTLDLRGAIEDIGITKIFSPEADFSPLTSDSVSIDSVLQSTRLRIDEQGLEGASYVEMFICVGAAPKRSLKPKVIRIDRPFAFAVVSPMNAPLLMGFMQHVDSANE